MTIRAVMQISNLDKQWGFNPEWVMDYGHLETLVNQIKEGEHEIDIHVLTTTKATDDEIEQYLQEQPLTINRLSPEKYSSTGLAEYLGSFSSEDIVVFSSAYLAIIPQRALELALEKIINEDLEIIRLRGSFRPYMPLVARSENLKTALKTCAENYKNVENKRLDLRIEWGYNPLIPHWIFPPRLDFSIFWRHSERAVVFTNKKITISKERIEVFDPYITSKHQATTWNQIQNLSEEKEKKKFNYSDKQEQYYLMRGRQNSFPPAIQIELSSKGAFLKGTRQVFNSELDFNKLLTALDKISAEISLKQVYLQIGVYNDPLTFDNFNSFLNRVNKNKFKIGLHTKGTGLDGSKSDFIIKNVDEVFFHFGEPDIESDNNYFTSEDQLNKYKLLLESRYNKRKNQKKGPYKTSPIISVVYNICSEEYIRLYGKIKKNWTEYSEALKEFKSQTNEFNYTDFYNFYYKQKDNTRRVIVSQNILSNENKLWENHEPLKRTPCSRSLEAIYIKPSGTICACDQAIKSSNLDLAAINNSRAIFEGWISEKRRKLVNSHVEEKFDTFKICGNCKKWFQPVI